MTMSGDSTEVTHDPALRGLAPDAACRKAHRPASLNLEAIFAVRAGPHPPHKPPLPPACLSPARRTPETDPACPLARPPVSRSPKAREGGRRWTLPGTERPDNAQGQYRWKAHVSTRVDAPGKEPVTACGDGTAVWSARYHETTQERSVRQTQCLASPPPGHRARSSSVPDNALPHSPTGRGVMATTSSPSHSPSPISPTTWSLLQYRRKSSPTVAASRSLSPKTPTSTSPSSPKAYFRRGSFQDKCSPRAKERGSFSPSFLRRALSASLLGRWRSSASAKSSGTSGASSPSPDSCQACDRLVGQEGVPVKGMLIHPACSMCSMCNEPLTPQDHRIDRAYRKDSCPAENSNKQFQSCARLSATKMASGKRRWPTVVWCHEEKREKGVPHINIEAAILILPRRKLWCEEDFMANITERGMKIVHYQRVNNLQDLDLEQSVMQKMNANIWHDLLEPGILQENCSGLRKLLHSISDIGIKFIISILTNGNTTMHLTDTSVAVLELLMNCCTVSHIPFLKERLMRNMLVTVCSQQQFRIFVHANNKYVQQAIVELSTENCLLMHLVQQTCLNRVTGREGSDGNWMAVACEAGLFSALGPSRTPPTRATDKFLLWAVKSNQPDLVRLLCRAGAASNHEIFQLSRHPMLIKRCQAAHQEAPSPDPSAHRYPSVHDRNAAQQIRQFLCHEASQPHSLLTLCVWEVCKHTGWGHERDSRVNQLKLPSLLKDRLNCKGNREFLTAQAE